MAWRLVWWEPYWHFFREAGYRGIRISCRGLHRIALDIPGRDTVPIEELGLGDHPDRGDYWDYPGICHFRMGVDNPVRGRRRDPDRRSIKTGQPGGFGSRGGFILYRSGRTNRFEPPVSIPKEGNGVGYALVPARGSSVAYIDQSTVKVFERLLGKSGSYPRATEM